MINRKIYKQEDIKKYMKIQINIPDYLNRMLKIEKAKRNQNYLQETIIQILDDYYKEWKEGDN